ncbi:MAG: methionyl-tRNA formyltransferase [Bacteroidota bacterium]|nr:methionyl-tRNA formyltransferase [Bacteroidota bacterium]MDP4234100.1 methionyl-tRNA formyltransferase [Bacteroidota bacterium]MDP4243041.1 methionyl-tRNA formyltransferase [Bacteroidota bacterium]MDP4287467.1 methionyl-tRNA formyltransferase [Bacteroidota bacterium]
MNPRNPGSEIVFFGTPEFAAHILRELVARGVNIVAAVTTPDKPRGRGLHVESSAVSRVATELGIPVFKPTKHRDPEFLQSLRELHADVFVVVAYKILPIEVIAIPRLGAFNVHASLLPKYRGAAPINWAIMRGESETGITTFLLEQGVDTGGILMQERTPIGPDETAGELHDRLMIMGARVAFDTIQCLSAGTLHPAPQSNEDATSAPKIFPKDCEIDIHKSALDIHNFIRGLSPHPGAWIRQEGLHLKLLRARRSDEMFDIASQAQGLFVSPGHKHLYLRTIDGVIDILEVQREGKRAMSAEEFLRGNMTLFPSHLQT